MRGFEFISKEQWEKDLEDFSFSGQVEYKKHLLPKRGTSHSAGYDFFSPVYTVIPPQGSIKIPTGIKSYMFGDEVLMIYPRSSLGFKTNIRLSNTVGIVDSDYYNNEDNEGHIWIKFFNPTDKPYTVEVGDKIAQGIFMKYLIADNDEAEGERIGGIGSTGK